MRRVAITGMGCVTAIGIGTERFFRSLREGRDGFLPLSEEQRVGLNFSSTARVDDFQPDKLLSPDQMMLSERSSQFALVAAHEAIEQSGMPATLDGSRIAVVFGCSAGGRMAEEPALEKLYTQGARVHPLTVPRAMANAGTSLVSMEYGITGPAYTVSTACASATHAIGQAFHMVRSGMVDAAITGGHEAPLTFGFLRAWNSLRVVSPTFCRPFAKDRDGMTLGEGSGVLVLEEMEIAERRGAQVLGEIVGFGMSSDARHITQPAPSGPAAAMRRALLDCGELRAPVRYINTHGTGTMANDGTEAEAIHMVFAEEAGRIPVSSTKSTHGHAMGASGALEAVATVLALQHGELPHTAHASEIDPELGLDVITGEPRRIERTSEPVLALSNSFAFGGLNAVLAFRSV
jgi:3-oxoacyl-[acyl-carrier-protein] synthase II/nodulation protein E